MYAIALFQNSFCCVEEANKKWKCLNMYFLFIIYWFSHDQFPIRILDYASSSMFDVEQSLVARFYPLGQIIRMYTARCPVWSNVEYATDVP